MKELIEKMEILIRAGKFGEVEKKLLKLGKVGRKDALAIANIARRINRLNMALKILNPLVRPEDPGQAPPTPLEKIEYAETLRRLGAVDEAWVLLSDVDTTDLPQAKLHKVFCLFNQWRYEEAVFILKKHDNEEGLTPYAHCVWKINLAAGLAHLGKLVEASVLLKDLRAETKDSKFLLLYGNSLELTSQVLILQRKYDEALAVLNESSEVLSGAGSIASLYIQKWKAIAESLKLQQTTPELREVFLKGQSEQHWETVRDCDLYMAHLDQDRVRFERLYFGTPYESFRQRILSFAGAEFKVPRTYLWASTKAPKYVFDLASGKVHGKKGVALPTGQALHRFMILLSRDFYRPLPAMSAFGKIFPDEFINAKTSVHRIYQIVRRCREWIAKVDLDIKIEQIGGDYKLVLGKNIGLQVPNEPLPLESKELEWNLLNSNVGLRPFDINEAKDILASSISDTRRLLRWAVEQNRVRKSGNGSQTRYLVVREKV